MFYTEAPSRIPPKLLDKPKIFLAGGIQSCPDWQADMRAHLVNTKLLLLNPRRADFPIHDPSAAQAQIEWEHTHLQMADAILFWFPCETLCPIVLFELGAWIYWQRGLAVEHGQIPFVPGHTADELRDHWMAQLGGINHEQKPLFVGVHPDYARRQDVEIQLLLQRPEIKVVSSLKELAAQVVDWSETC